MSDQKPYNEPAFPCNSPDGQETYRGMSLRDYFAGQALVGSVERMAEVQGLGSPTFPQNVAAHAYTIADAMLREKTKP